MIQATMQMKLNRAKDLKFDSVNELITIEHIYIAAMGKANLLCPLKSTSCLIQPSCCAKKVSKLYEI